MIKIKWVITDNLSDITLEEFDNEWNGIISGYFELTINQNKEGFCPQRKIKEDEEGLEDILYWLNHLLKGVHALKKGEEYEMFLLTMNVYRLVMKLDEGLHISFINNKNNETKWTEVVSMQEFESELYESIEAFIQFIKKTNPTLMDSKWINRLKCPIN